MQSYRNNINITNNHTPILHVLFWYKSCIAIIHFLASSSSSAILAPYKSIRRPANKMTNACIPFIDIGANLLDDMYQGVYRGKERHEADIEGVLERAFLDSIKDHDSASSSSVLDKIVVTAGNLEESRKALAFVRKLEQKYPNRLFCTVGVHPTRCNEIYDNDNYIQEMLNLCNDGMSDGKVVAVGELGLDYKRTEFCDIEVQKRGFLEQLSIAEETKLPLFLHNRETGDDLLDIIRENRNRFSRGVVHSFDDTAELASKFVDLDLYIGINGCSLKTSENLEVVKTLPLNRLLLETDCPWCDIRASHAGFHHVKTKYPTKPEKKYEKGCCVKSRYEPCHIIQVAEVVAGVKDISVDELAKVVLQNTNEFYGFK